MAGYTMLTATEMLTLLETSKAKNPNKPADAIVFDFQSAPRDGQFSTRWTTVSFVGPDGKVYSTTVKIGLKEKFSVLFSVAPLVAAAPGGKNRMYDPNITLSMFRQGQYVKTTPTQDPNYTSPRAVYPDLPKYAISRIIELIDEAAEYEFMSRVERGKRFAAYCMENAGKDPQTVRNSFNTAEITAGMPAAGFNIIMLEEEIVKIKTKFSQFQKVIVESLLLAQIISVKNIKLKPNVVRAKANGELLSNPYIACGIMFQKQDAKPNPKTGKMPATTIFKNAAAPRDPAFNVTRENVHEIITAGSEIMGTINFSAFCYSQQANSIPIKMETVYIQSTPGAGRSAADDIADELMEHIKQSAAPTASAVYAEEAPGASSPAAPATLATHASEARVVYEPDDVDILAQEINDISAFPE